jgi:hypothetical protein
MVVLLQVLVPNHWYRLLSDVWIRWRTRERESRGVTLTDLPDRTPDRMSDRPGPRPVAKSPDRIW